MRTLIQLKGQALSRFFSYPVRPSVVTPEEPAEEKTGQMVSQGTVQLPEEQLHPERSTRANHCVETFSWRRRLPASNLAHNTDF